MRKFYIENSVGERLSLCDHHNLWLNLPKGLGMEMDVDYASVEPGFWEVSSFDEKQSSITGTLLFLDSNPYKSFREITDWLITAASLKFIYCPYGTEEYYRDIHINKIDKGEKTLSRMLSIPMTITPLTPWYDRAHLTFIFAVSQDSSHKRYNYHYPYRYALSAIPNSVDFQIGGHYPGEIELRANGPFNSPILTLTNTITKVVLGRLDLSGMLFDQGETLCFSSRVNNPGVWKMSGGVKTDLIDEVFLDANIETFFKVPPNTPVTATMVVSGTMDGGATMDVLKYYRLR